jgi:hypothetical protein
MLRCLGLCSKVVGLRGPGGPRSQANGMLRLRWMWLQRTDPGKPLAAMPLHEDNVTRAFFKASPQFVVGTITTNFF